MPPRLLFVHALSPLHAGTGQSTGAIDLAIARDRATGFPYLPGSSIKGSLRDRARATNLANLTSVFGPETDKASEHAGALVVGDANLLLLPVRSVAGTFAYATSPYLLQRFLRDCREAKIQNTPIVPAVGNIGSCIVGAESTLLVGTRVVLEDLDMAKDQAANANPVAAFLANLLFAGEENRPWNDGLRKRICIVHDDVMAFLAEHGTDVVARIRLNAETKTVDGGALWYEENLPTETLLASVCLSMGNGKINEADTFKALDGLCTQPLQLGGKATVGRGRCKLTLRGAP